METESDTLDNLERTNKIEKKNSESINKNKVETQNKTSTPFHDENTAVVSSNDANGFQKSVHKGGKVTEVSRNDQAYENGKRKNKEEKPATKVIVRRLPPTMTKEIFLEQVSPLAPYDYMYFVNGDLSYGISSFSRAYLNFVHHEDVFNFTRTFDNYVFLDSKGQEYPAIVEFSPFQRVPKQRSKKKDTLTGTIESDSMYISFKENLLAEALENSKTGAKTVKQHYFETEISATEEVNTTPLLEFLKQKRAEKARIRDERREEKKRKDAERKLKQKTKEKKTDGEEEEAKDIKIQHCIVPPDKSCNNGHITQRHNSEKVSENNRKIDEREMYNNISVNMNESLLKNGNVTIKQRKKKSLNNFSSESLEVNNCQSVTVSSKIEYDKEHRSHNSNIPAVNGQNNESDKQTDKSWSSGEVKKAEQQTQYLRKMLGINEDNNSLKEDIDKSSDKTCLSPHNKLFNTSFDSNPNQRKLDPKIFTSSGRALWSDSNINPDLPSASFKTSSNLIGTKDEKESSSMCNNKGLLTSEFRQVNRPFKGEIVIDRALCTDNLLPSAFRKAVMKDIDKQH